MRIFAIALCLLSAAANATEINVSVLDASGKPMVDAVVYADPAKPGATTKARKEVFIEQINKAFVPLISVIQSGSAVNFPNRDSVRHHVYSFSPAKTFEIKLFSGVPAKPVIFEKPGEVVIGCNIHDQMIAHVLVVDTPYFAKSGSDGIARLEGLPPGNYTIHAWHPSAVPVKEAISLSAAGHKTQFKLAPRAQAPLPR